MGILDNAKDMQKKAQDKLSSTDIDDKAKARLDEMRKKHDADSQSDMKSM